MKRFLVTTAAILVLLLVCFTGYVQYRKWVSFRTLIHKDATSLIRINVYGIIQSAAIDLIRGGTSPGKKEHGKKEPEEKTGIDLPANVFVYTVKGKAATTLFTSLSINDRKAFERTVRKLLKEPVTDSTNPVYTVIAGLDGQVTIAYNKAIAAIAYSAGREEVLSILTDVLAERNVVPVAESRFSEIKKRTAHIAYMDEHDNHGLLRFKDGRIIAGVFLPVDGLQLPEQTTHPVRSSQSCLNFWLNADLKKMLTGKKWTIDRYTIEGDSLLKYYHGATQLEVKGTVLQKDSIITYGYNDNFEKIAQVELRETAVPQIQAMLRADGSGLYRYLAGQGLIHADSGIVNRAVFPLYQLYVWKTATGLQLGTGKTPPANKQVTDRVCSGLEVDFDQLLRQQQIPMAGKYLQPLKSLSVKAFVESDQLITIDAVLHFDDAHKNAAVLLMDLCK